ncbi:MAG: sugar phosphate isomerase/epimerase, partial [Opitutae bacterium]
TARRVDFKLGVATVTLKALPLENMLAAVHKVGLDKISLHRAHSPWENNPPAWRAVADKIRAAGISPLCCGVLYLKNDEAAMRRMLDYVRTLGVPLFSCSPEPAALPLLDRLVREYDLRAAIHNHGPEDKSWPGATSVLRALEPLDPRIGLCLDVGHSFRAGEDPAAIIQRHHGRIYDLHIKDSIAEVGQEDVPVEMGRGKLDLPGILTALVSVGYAQSVWLEYEKDPNDPVTGLAESVGFVRGVLAGMLAR